MIIFFYMNYMNLRKIFKFNYILKVATSTLSFLKNSISSLYTFSIISLYFGSSCKNLIKVNFKDSSDLLLEIGSLSSINIFNILMCCSLSIFIK